MAKKWEIDRRTGIGGSDAAAILGLSPWKSAMQVWMEKRGLAEDKPDPGRDFLLELGTQLEPVISSLYERETGKHLQLPFPVMVRHPEHSFLFGSPDRVIEGEEKGVELKSESQFADKFGEPGTDQIPYHYLIQCAHYMAVTGFAKWDVALLHAGSRFAVYHLDRDMDLERQMIGQLRDWWERYVVGDQPPDVDGSGAWNVYLQRKYPVDILPILPGDASVNNLIRQLDFVRNLQNQMEANRAKLETKIKLLIEDHEGIAGEFGRVTWKKTKDINRVDWKAAFAELSAETPVRCAQILQKHLQVAPGTRRFLLQLKEGWSYGNENPRGEIASGEDSAGNATPAGNGIDGAGSASESADRSALCNG